MRGPTLPGTSSRSEATLSETRNWHRILRQTERYYRSKVDEHGATARGVDWDSEESQTVRFDQLLRLVAGDAGPFSLIDYGCGYGALVDHLDSRGLTPAYHGFDLSPEMVRHARERHRHHPSCRFTTSMDEIQPARYMVASGIFNVKQDVPTAEWQAYVLSTIDQMAGLSNEGFAFNVLTLDSDADHRRPDLYYADPSFFLDRCRQRYSPWVALLQDYGLYEFTMIIRRNGETSWRK